MLEKGWGQSKEGARVYLTGWEVIEKLKAGGVVTQFGC